MRAGSAGVGTGPYCSFSARPPTAPSPRRRGKSARSTGTGEPIDGIWQRHAMTAEPDGRVASNLT